MVDSTTLCFDADVISLRLQKRQKPIPPVGSKYTRLTFTGSVALRDTVLNNGRRSIVFFLECSCECGKTGYYPEQKLQRGDTHSCGCYSRDITSARRKAEPLKYKQTTKGGYPLQDVWRGMKARCSDPTHPNYKLYGHKGISVCIEWADFIVFETWAWSNGYRRGLSIDRINGHLGYCPSNCRWVDQATQMRNTSRNVNITMHGETKCMRDWLDDPRTSCTDAATYLNRVNKKGMTPEQAMMAEKQRGGRYPKPSIYRPWPE